MEQKGKFISAPQIVCNIYYTTMTYHLVWTRLNDELVYLSVANQPSCLSQAAPALTANKQGLHKPERHTPLKNQSINQSINQILFV